MLQHIRHPFYWLHSVVASRSSARVTRNVLFIYPALSLALTLPFSKSAAVYAACADSQVQHDPGIGVVVLDSLGLLNAINAVKSAQQGHIPLLVIVGTTAMILKVHLAWFGYPP